MELVFCGMVVSTSVCSVSFISDLFLLFGNFYPFLFLLSMYYNMDVFSLQVGSMKLLEKEVKYLQKGGVVMDVHAKLRQMMEERNWTE